VNWFDLAVTFVGSATFSGAVSAIVAARMKRGENRQLHDQGVELERLRSNLRILEDQSHVRFDWMHQKRAQAIMDVYASLIDLDRHTRTAIGQLTHGNLKPEEKVTLMQAIVDSSSEFSERYSKAEILFDDEAVGALARLERLYWEKFTVAHVFGRDQTPDDRLRLAAEGDWSKIADALDVVKAQLRRLLGSVESSARKPVLS
jgi:hypothetical protein